jgi:actin-like ATPase involved in cell morphogenesis
MSYALGIDLGTTYTAAATARNGRAEVTALGYRATSVPSVVFLTADGRFLVGDAAERRAAHEPDRVAREFKRRVGDPTPLLLGGAPIPVDRCLAEVLRWVVATIGETEGAPPSAVTVTHPANWGEFKRDVLREALRLVDVPNPRLLAEPVAAATWYAQAERLAPGQTIAVYDLGGGTFDATVLRRRADGRFESLGRAEGIERLGGIDVDEAVLGHVLRALGQDASVLDHGADDPALMTAFAQLRRACVEAKEALSSETSVAIPVWFRGVHREVLLQRAELEELVGPLLRPTVEALARVVASAGLQPGDLDAVLLVGGSSRIPMIARQVETGLGRPVVVDAHPKHPVALGAALDAGVHAASLARATPPPPPGAVAPTASLAPPVVPSIAPQRPTPPPPGPAGAPGSGRIATAPPPPFRSPAVAHDATPVRALPPLPVASPGGDIDRSSRRVLMAASLATPIVLVLAIVLYVLQSPGEPAATSTDGGPGSSEVTGSTSEGGPTTASTTTTTVPVGGSLLADPTPALDGFASIYESPRVRAITLHPDLATAEVQVQGQPTYLDRYTWREGNVEGPEPLQLLDMEVEELEGKLFSLSEIDPAVIAPTTQNMLQNCPGEGLELTHVIIERDLVFDEQGRVLMLVYASNPVRGGGGYIAYTLDGTLVRNAC